MAKPTVLLPAGVCLSWSGKGIGKLLGMCKCLVMINHRGRGRTLSIQNNYLKIKKSKIIKLWNRLLPKTKPFYKLISISSAFSGPLMTMPSLPFPRASAVDLAPVSNNVPVPKANGWPISDVIERGLGAALDKPFFRGCPWSPSFPVWFQPLRGCISGSVNGSSSLTPNLRCWGLSVLCQVPSRLSLHILASSRRARPRPQRPAEWDLQSVGKEQVSYERD